MTQSMGSFNPPSFRVFRSARGRFFRGHHMHQLPSEPKALFKIFWTHVCITRCQPRVSGGICLFHHCLKQSLIPGGSIPLSARGMSVVLVNSLYRFEFTFDLVRHRSVGGGLCMLPKSTLRLRDNRAHASGHMLCFFVNVGFSPLFVLLVQGTNCQVRCPSPEREGFPPARPRTFLNAGWHLMIPSFRHLLWDHCVYVACRIVVYR